MDFDLIVILGTLAVFCVAVCIAAIVVALSGRK